MKVLLVSGIYFPDIGGPATYLPRLASALIEKGHEVQSVSLTDTGDVIRPHESWERTFVPRNINKWSRTFKLVRIIREKAKKSDFIFTNGLFIETALALIGLNCHSTAKIVGDPVWERLKNKRGTKYSVDEFAIRFTGVKTLIQRKTINLALSQFNQLTAPSENLARNIRHWGVKKEITVIPNGVACLKVESNHHDYDVVSLARLVTWKQIDILIEACAIANLKLAIAGDGPERRNLEELAAKTQCDAHFFGKLDREDSIHLLRRSKIFALISTYEGLSFALIEAMMLEKCILVSNIPGNTAVITDHVEGLLTEALSAREVSEKLSILNSDQMEIRLLGRSARAKAQLNFCEEKQLSKMTDLLTDISK